MGFASEGDYIASAWEERFPEFDANDFLAMVATWQARDISANGNY